MNEKLELNFDIPVRYYFTADCEAAARDWLDNVYEVEHRALDEAAVQADWVYNTNINQENSDASVRRKSFIY